jgi:hypothetical protein
MKPPDPTQLQNVINQLTIFIGEADIERRSLIKGMQQISKRVEELEAQIAELPKTETPKS